MSSNQCKICKNCKTENSDIARYCSQCGTPLEEADDAAAAEQASVKSGMCPRCRRVLDEGESQCPYCGEITNPKRRIQGRVNPKPQAINSPTADPSLAVLRQMLQPMRFTGPAAWWILACVIVALICTGFAFYTNEEQYIVVAICAGGFIFAPFLIIILGYLFALAVLCRKEITLISIAVVALIGLGYLVYIIAHSGMSFSFVTVAELFRNENFTKTAMTFIISSAVLIALYPLIKFLSGIAMESRSVFSYKAETERQVGLKAIENDTTVRLRTLENERETTLRKLDIEEQQTRLNITQIEADKAASRQLLTHVSPPKEDKADKS